MTMKEPFQKIIEISNDTTDPIPAIWGKEIPYSRGKMNIYPFESSFRRKMYVLPSRKGLNKGKPVSNHSLDVSRIDSNGFRTVHSSPPSIFLC